MTTSSFKYSDEIKQAIAAKLPIVALESTIISHGMPYPQNVEVAREVEAQVRLAGAVPATIAILWGEVHIGLMDSELIEFAQLTDVVKCSRRDLPLVMALKNNGATTVATTMLFAAQAGIRFFATGGIGGVHRGAESTWDVSADLPEFTLSPVAVVSAGAKAILDLPKTLEYLETLGVPVIGYNTKEFPAFYTPHSGFSLVASVADAVQMAQILHSGWSSQTMVGALIANPIPMEFALDSEWIESQIQDAIQQATAQGIQGKLLTPFLLKYLNEITQGKSQVANRALVINNAQIAAEIAVRYHSIKK